MEAFPDSVLFSTEPLGWQHVNAQRRIRPQGGVTDLPAGMNEHVVLVWHGPTHVSSLLGGTRQEANASTGPTQFVPARTPILWERRSPFHFTKVVLGSAYVDELMLDLFDRDPSKNPLVPRPIYNDAILRARAHSLVSHALSDDPANQLVVDEVAQQLGVHLIATYGGLVIRGRCEQQLSPAQLSNVIDFVEANLGNAVTLDALAGVACVSKYHFLRRFRLTTGMTPHQFVIQRRISRAKEFVLSGRLTMVQIAHLTGFSDQAHFTRVFKKALGTTPKSFQGRAQ
jgi:AraC family transcriptional regulator